MSDAASDATPDTAPEAAQEAPSLLEKAEQFTQDLIANNVAGLMPTFTPNGMMQAMAMQQDPNAGTAAGTTEHAIKDQGGNLLHITLRGPESAGGDGTIYTQWVEGPMGWQIDTIGRLD